LGARNHDNDLRSSQDKKNLSVSFLRHSSCILRNSLDENGEKARSRSPPKRAMSVRYICVYIEKHYLFTYLYVYIHIYTYIYVARSYECDCE
jgi:hypothetical protein